MLCITRREGEQVRIGPDVWVKVGEIRRGKVTLLFSAPQSVEIVREELIGQYRRPAPEAVPPAT